MNNATSSDSLRTGVLGPGAVVFFVVSAAGPLVAMAGGIPMAMLFGNGAGLPAMFLIASIVLLAFATGYTAMARDVRSAGAFYAFAELGLGSRAAGATGMIALLSYNAIQVGLYGLFGAAAGALLDPLLGTSPPWWCYSGLALASIAVLGFRQVDLSAKILGLLVVCEYLVVVVVDIAIFAAGGSDGINSQAFSPQVVNSGSPTIGLMLCFGAFVGFEATTIYSEEARDPARTIPLATYVSVVLIGAFYTVSSWAMVIGTGTDELIPLLRADPTEVLFSLADHYVGGGLPLAMRILFVTSAFASLLAFHNTIARYLFAMGREGLLPLHLARTHPHFGSPHIGSVVQSAVAAVCVGSFAIVEADPLVDVFTVPSAVATLGVIVLMAITAVAAVAHLRSRASMLIQGLTVLSFLAFICIAALATIRFDVLAGADTRLVKLLPFTIIVAAVLGVFLTGRISRSRA